MAYDKDGITELPPGISYKKDRDTYMGRFQYEGELYWCYDKKLSGVQKKLNDLRYEVEHSLYAKESNITVDSWFNVWLYEYKKSEVKRGTLIAYLGIYTNYVQKPLGKKKLKQLRPEHIQKLFNTLAETYTKKTIKLVKAVLNGMYQQAIINRLVRENPVSLARIPRAKEEMKREALTKEEQNTFMKYLIGSPCENLLRIALGTGLRIGELRALQWKYVDFDKKLIHVRHTIKTSKGEGYWLDDPKTPTSNRDVYMLESVYYLLRREKKFQLQNRLLAGEYWQPDEGLEDLVFTTDTGRPYSHTAVNTAIKKIQKEMEKDGVHMVKITPHILRHTFATRGLEQGIPPKVMQEFLGHSSISITMDVYSHVSPQLKEMEMKKLEDII